MIEGQPADLSGFFDEGNFVLVGSEGEGGLLPQIQCKRPDQRLEGDLR